MVKNNSVQNYKHLKESCIPFLDKLNIKHFYYGLTSWDGYLTEISTHFEWTFFYADNHLYRINPFKQNPKRVQAGMYYNGDLEAVGSIRNECSKFGIYGALDFVEKREDGIVRYGFSVGDSDPQARALLLNELSLIKKFVTYFESQAKSLLHSSQAKSVYLPSLIGPQFFEEVNLPKTSLTPQERFKALSVFEEGDSCMLQLKLSKRELECIRMTVAGNTALEIAETLNISRRTVEHYIENVRQKLNCGSKADFVSKLETLKILGLIQL